MLLKVKFFGDVQGVGFRYSVSMKAREFGLAGFIRNEDDNVVYMEAEGLKEKLEELLGWIKNDAPGKIEKFERQFLDEVGGYDGFEVR